MPTFRYELNDDNVMKVISEGNFFAFKDFDANSLNNKLKELHQYLIIKLHPYEMKKMQMDKIKVDQYSNIYFLKNDYLEKNNLDLYELLGSTDYLMTDFSSIYFDYLHLNKPIFFITNYLEQYETARSLLITPYNEVVPGATVENQIELLQKLADLSNDSYEQKRNYWLQLTDTLPTGNNCERNFDTL